MKAIDNRKVFTKSPKKKEASINKDIQIKDEQNLGITNKTASFYHSTIANDENEKSKAN